jgi:hypothetical protein
VLIELERQGVDLALELAEPPREPVALFTK